MKQTRSDVGEWIQAILIAVILALFIRSFLFETTLVHGSSMLPSLHHRDRIIINKLMCKFYPPKRGDIVVFKNPSNPKENYVKRVIGVPGDYIEIKKDEIYVNDAQLPEPYLYEPIMEDFPKVLVPSGTVFVMGDNRNHSEDSRKPWIGFVPAKNVLGKAQLRIWPLSNVTWFP